MSTSVVQRRSNPPLPSVQSRNILHHHIATTHSYIMGSIDTNPPNADLHISNHGTDWLWAVFAVMAFSMLGMFAWSYTASPPSFVSVPYPHSIVLVQRPRGTRFFHNIALIILTTSAIAYFSMASNLGATPIDTEFRRDGSRQIWVCSLSFRTDISPAHSLQL